MNELHQPLFIYYNRGRSLPHKQYLAQVVLLVDGAVWISQNGKGQLVHPRQPGGIFLFAAADEQNGRILALQFFVSAS